jgi:hypothetical protein
VIFGRNWQVMTTILVQASVGQVALQSSAIDISRVTDGLRDLATADLDHNGALDLLAELSVGLGNTRHIAFITDGLGGVTRTVLQSFSVTDLVSGLVACELNGDGRVDLAWISGADRTIQAREGGPGLTFGLQRTVQSTDPGAAKLRAAHLNTDGISDFIVGQVSTLYAQASRSLSVGPWLWGLQQAMVGLERRGDVITQVDLDGDGDIDVISGPRGGRLLSLYRNELFVPIGMSECGPGVTNSTGGPSTILAVGSKGVAD